MHHLYQEGPQIEAEQIAVTMGWSKLSILSALSRGLRRMDLVES